MRKQFSPLKECPAIGFIIKKKKEDRRTSSFQISLFWGVGVFIIYILALLVGT